MENLPRFAPGTPLSDQVPSGIFVCALALRERPFYLSQKQIHVLMISTWYTYVWIPEMWQPTFGNSFISTASAQLRAESSRSCFN